MGIGKRLKSCYESYDSQKLFSVEDAVKIVKTNAKAKFDETIDISMNLGVDPRQSDQMVRGMVPLPSGTGKDVKVAVFAKGDKQKEATEAGADYVGDDDLAEKITSGNIEFDRVISTPDLMGVVGKLGKVLGPRGLMPNPKLGTVTNDIQKAVKDAKSGQVEIRNDKDGNIGLSIGKKSFKDEMLLKNYNAVIDALEKEKSNLTIKGNLVKQAFITSTMGVSYKLKLDKTL